MQAETPEEFGDRLQYAIARAKVATTLEAMEKLIEQSFEYITDTNVGATTYKLFRREKTWRPN